MRVTAIETITDDDADLTDTERDIGASRR